MRYRRASTSVDVLTVSIFRKLPKRSTVATNPVEGNTRNHTITSPPVWAAHEG